MWGIEGWDVAMGTRSVSDVARLVDCVVSQITRCPKIIGGAPSPLGSSDKVESFISAIRWHRKTTSFLIFRSLDECGNDTFAVRVESFDSQQPLIPVATMRYRIAEVVGRFERLGPLIVLANC